MNNYPRESGRLEYSGTLADYPRVAAWLERAYQTGRPVALTEPLAGLGLTSRWWVRAWATWPSQGETWWHAVLEKDVPNLDGTALGWGAQEPPKGANDETNE